MIDPLPDSCLFSSMKSIRALCLSILCFQIGAISAFADFQAGAAVVDVTPEILPVIVNGGMTGRMVDTVDNRIHARAIVISDGEEQIAIVVVDSCMMPRPLLDSAKKIAALKTRIPPENMLISATHTHSAPSSMGCLGSNPDENYVPFLIKKLVEAIVAAQKNLEPAQAGFNSADAAEFTALRRWIHLPDSMVPDPFGNPTGRANMHTGRDWSKVAGESGPEDPQLSLISIQAADGRPIAVLANFSMHYFGDKALGADYFGRFSEGLKTRLAPEAADGKPAFVGMMSHGCSGDIWRRDYTKPVEERNEKQPIDEYTEGLLDIAMKAYESIEYKADRDLEMEEARLNLAYRVPDAQRLQWAQKIVSETEDPDKPKTKEEVYARAAVMLHEKQRTDIVVQGLRIGDDIAIATTPNETYAITGLKIKAGSPVKNTMVIELANGGDGYIPPPEQHLLGGYNTWEARSAGLEVLAEPKITATALRLLENVSGKSQVEHVLSKGPATTAILDLKPAAYWRLDEFAGPLAVDFSGNNRDAVYEPQVMFFLEGPRSDYFCEDGEKNRAAHFVDDRLRARINNLEDTYSISLWFWNGMPVDRRDETGWLFSRDRDLVLSNHGDHLGISGKASPVPGKLAFFHGADPTVTVFGKADIKRWTWNHLVLTRQEEFITVHLNGILDLETEAPADFPADLDRLFFGGRSDNSNNFEGRLDEISAFNRALSAKEIEALGVQ